MKNPLVKLSLYSILLGSIVFSSCRKNNDRDSDWSAATDNALAESSFNELKNIADEAYSGNMQLYRATEDTLVFGCATVIRDTTGSVKTLTVDFGTTNCACNDGKNRRGKVIVTYTGFYRDSATVITHTPDNYYVNDNQLLGTKTVTNMGRNGSGNIWFDIAVNGQVIKANNGGTISWVSDREREWVAGESTLTWLDDSYLITGNASGTRSNGEAFTVDILTALKVNLSCRYIVSGSLQVTPANHSARLVDYGTGACDNQATVTINGNVYNVTLP